MTKVFVVYADYGAYEGCKVPHAAFSTKEAAALWIYEAAPYWQANAKIIELDIDQPKDHTP